MFGGLINLKYICSEGGGTSKMHKSIQGGGGPKINEIECTYFLNGSYLKE